MKPPTYPARPLNGGALDCALPKRGDWRAEPKYNGWRALVHAPTGAMFNRWGEHLSIESEFRRAWKAMREYFSDFDWLDCEALSRRHALGKGSLIILDVIPPPQSHIGATYLERRKWIETRSVETLELQDRPCNGFLYIAPSYLDDKLLWNQCRAANVDAGCDFYEGIVCKRTTAPYPIQRISATRETADWIKHRWRVDRTPRVR